MSESRRGLFRRIVLLLAIGVSSLLALAIVSVDDRSEKAQAAWDEAFGGIEERLARYPARIANRAALELHILARPLGISLQAPMVRDGTTPSVDDPGYAAVRDEIASWVAAQAVRGDRDIEPAPPAVHGFLADRAGPLAALRRFLLDGETPRWGRDIERVFGLALYNPHGQRDLPRLLLADALQALHEGRRDRAADDLEACWKLFEGMSDDLGFRRWSLLLGNLQLIAGVARHVEALDPVWRERLDPRLLREPMLDTLRHYGWLWSRVDETLRWDSNVTIVRRVLGAAVTPYVQLCQIDTEARFEPSLERLIELDHLCDRDLAAAGVHLDWRVPWWNSMADDVSRFVVDFVDRWRQVAFELEATRHVLDLDRERDARSFFVPSAECPEDNWVYVFASDGHAQVSFSRDVAWDGRGNLPPLATTFRVRPD